MVDNEVVNLFVLLNSRVQGLCKGVRGYRLGILELILRTNPQTKNINYNK